MYAVGRYLHSIVIGENMKVEDFLLEMAESEECQKIMYKRLSIHMYIGLYYSMKPERGCIDPFMIPFRDFTKNQIKSKEVDIDELINYMIDNDESHCALFLATTLFTPKQEFTSLEYAGAIARYKIISPFVDSIDMDIVALIVVSFVFDNLYPRKIDISAIIGKEIFAYPTNQYNLTRVNGAIFKKDGLIYDGKGYYYNYFTNKTMIDQYDRMAGFAKIITDEANDCDILYRLDERLSMPESEYFDYTGVAFAKYRGPQFNFSNSVLEKNKTIIVHYDETTLDKLLMVIKQDVDQTTGEDFLHIEIETLPHKNNVSGCVITTFLHGMYYPQTDIFTHIDYTKNQYDGDIYLQKYLDSQNGVPIDQYTETKELHYKIWCVEKGKFTKEMWYKLMIVSLPDVYQKLLNEILGN